ncbi:MAG TPA: class II aldolase/adducin family protein [Candidatus Limnocylindria bacterium]|nr:class II aldolase/adducin family protein [Candidatus Limnocylindria bacterium]
MSERDVRLECATATRVLAVAGLFDMHGHLSIRDGDVIYICDRGASRLTVGPELIASARVSDGARLSDALPPSETALHLAAYRARPEVRSAAHFHPLYATAFAVAGLPLEPASNAGAFFGGTIPVHDNPELIRSDELGAPVARDLGAATAVLLRGHGALVVGGDVPECVTAALYLEESAQRNYLARNLGSVKAYTGDEIRRVREMLTSRFVIEKTWLYALEKARVAGALADLG